MHTFDGIYSNLLLVYSRPGVELCAIIALAYSHY